MTLILTLALDGESAARFEGLRRRYFPPERNRVPAHVMLFHRLPLANEPAIARDLADAAASTAPFEAAVREPRSIGSGVAYDLESSELLRLHAILARKWSGDLIPQDRERYRPHVVVANKVTPAAARATLETLRGTYARFTAIAQGLTLWTYVNGFWEDPRNFHFR